MLLDGLGLSQGEGDNSVGVFEGQEKELGFDVILMRNYLRFKYWSDIYSGVSRNNLVDL